MIATMVSPNPASVLDTIAARHSVRSYAPHEVDDTTLNSLLEAAVRAPTALHEEPWGFVIVENPDTLARISARAKSFIAAEAKAHHDRGGHTLEMFLSPEFNLFYDAPALILICGEGTGPFVAADCWLAAENLMLAACAMGLGTCVIGSAIPALNDPAIKSELGIPAGFTAIAPIIVGVPRTAGGPTPRRAPRVLAWR